MAAMKFYPMLLPETAVPFLLEQSSVCANVGRFTRMHACTFAGTHLTYI